MSVIFCPKCGKKLDGLNAPCKPCGWIPPRKTTVGFRLDVPKTKPRAIRLLVITLIPPSVLVLTFASSWLVFPFGYHELETYILSVQLICSLPCLVGILATGLIYISFAEDSKHLDERQVKQWRFGLRAGMTFTAVAFWYLHIWKQLSQQSGNNAELDPKKKTLE